MQEDDAPDSSPSVGSIIPGLSDHTILPRLRQSVKRGKDARALNVVREVMATPDAFFAAIGGIRRPFIARGRGRVLMGFLLDLPTEQLRHMSIIGALIELSLQPDSPMSTAALISLLDARGALREVRFQPTDYVQKYAKLGLENMKVLAACKYGTLVFGSRAALWEAVERAATRLYMPKAVADFLFGLSRDQAAGREAWEADLRAGFALDHVTQDHVVMERQTARRDWTIQRRREALDVISDAAGVERTFGALQGPEGLLLLTFHGGMIGPAREMYDLYCPPGLTLEGTKSRNQVSGAKTDQFGAGFAALKALSGGGVVLMAPDGGRGQAASAVEIAGIGLSLPDGGPFLAFESGCRTAWYTAVRQGDQVVPLIVPGPQRQEGERFKAYRTRFFDFYARQIEALLCGDPKSLALRPRWIDYIRFGKSMGEDD